MQQNLHLTQLSCNCHVLKVFKFTEIIRISIGYSEIFFVMLSLMQLNFFSYYSNWYNISPKIQKKLLILMISAKKVTPINVGKNFILSFEFYASVSNTLLKDIFIL